MIENGLVEYVTNVLAPWCGERVFHIAAPARCATPYAIIRKLSGEPYLYQGGENGAEDARFELRLYCTRHRDALEMRDALREQLAGFSGYMREHQVVWVSREGEYEDYEGGEGTAEGTFFIPVDYRLIYSL